MTTTLDAQRLRPLWFIDDLATVQLDGAATGGAFDVVELEGRRGDMPPLHVHLEVDEAFYVLEGELSLHLPGRSVRLEAGRALLAPHGVPHVYRVESDRARWLALGTPAGFADFVREAGDEPEAPGLPPAGRVHDQARLAEVAARHGIELLGPPGTLPSP
ncbi:MAG TPA: cupin domain-containing protein [Gaiellaceae bacterium]|nr:cupin domain-containing protein [Gaiellaceae bacterium]